MTLTTGAYHTAAEWPEVEAVPGVFRRVLTCGDQMMVVQFRIKADAEVPLHSHPHEQIGHVVSGRMTSPTAWPSTASTPSATTTAS